MRVLYDYQMFTIQKYGGISRYFFELIKRGSDTQGNTVSLGLKFSNNAYLNKESTKGLYPFFLHTQFYSRDRLHELINKQYSIFKIRSGDFDVLHPTFYDPYFLEFLKPKKPFVVTCYDMIHEIFGEKFPQLVSGIGANVIANKRKLLTTATKIIAISEQTKQDIINTYNIDGKKIEVTYLGNSFTKKPLSNEEPIVKEPYLLFVGSRPFYKNYSGLLKGIHQLLKQNRIKLICAGGGEFNDSELKEILGYGLENHVINIPIKNDHQLSNLYSNAIAFIFPSLYEGFGIPVLEAFACECPLVTSTGGSLSEVGGNAAIYFDPENPESINDAVSKVINNSSLRQELVKNGLRRLERFSWDNTYAETQKIYRSLL